MGYHMWAYHDKCERDQFCSKALDAVKSEEN